MAPEKIPLWRDDRFLRIAGQLIVLIIVITVIAWLGNNLVTNFRKLGLTFGFGFLERTASFGIGDTPISYDRSDPYSRAILIGLLNSLRVIIIGIVLATAIGITTGVARLSNNWIIKQIASIYVEIFRNTPLLLQLFFWYFAVFLKLPAIDKPLSVLESIYLTKKGLDIPWPLPNSQTWLSLAFLIISIILAIVIWTIRTQAIVKRGESGQPQLIFLMVIAIAFLLAFIFGLDWQQPQFDPETPPFIDGGLNLSPEFATILFGVSFYTAAFIAEVVRAGIQSVNKGQWEAARALGLKPSLVMYLVIFPQALRVMIPPLTSEYLNLAKNSSLATAIGYFDIYAVSNTIANQSGRSIEMLLIVMGSYLTLNLIISLAMNLLNFAVKIKER